MPNQPFGGITQPFGVPGAAYGAQMGPTGGGFAGGQIGSSTPGFTPGGFAGGQMMQNAVVGDAGIPYKGMQQQQKGQWGGGQLMHPAEQSQGFLGDFQGASGGSQMPAGGLGGMGGLLGMLAQSLNPALSLLGPMGMLGGGMGGGFGGDDDHRHHHDEDEGDF